MTYEVIKYIKGNPYRYLVRSQREGDTVRQIFVRYLGRADKGERESVEVEPVEREVRERPVATVTTKPTVPVAKEIPPTEIESKPEISTPPVVETQKTREPWEMTKAEYISTKAGRGTEEELTTAWHAQVERATQQGKPVPKAIIQQAEELSRKVNIRPEPQAWEMSWQDWAKQRRLPYATPYDQNIAKKTHEGLIKEALAEGKPVSYQVLKDYPSLTTTPTIVETKETKEPWEMTKEEWEQTLKDRRKTAIEEWNKQGAKGFPPSTGIPVTEIAPLAERAGYVLPRDAEKVLSIPYHQLQVEVALNEGKEIPPEVLKDYPSLTTTPTPVKERTPATPEVNVFEKDFIERSGQPEFYTPEAKIKAKTFTQLISTQYDAGLKTNVRNVHIGKVKGEDAWADGFMLEIKPVPDKLKAVEGYREMAKTTEGQPRDFTSLVPDYSTNGIEVKPILKTDLETINGQATFLASEDKDQAIAMDSKYVDYFLSNYPDAKFITKTGKISYPINVQSKGKTVGTIMPISKEQSEYDIFLRYTRSGEAVAKTAEPEKQEAEPTASIQEIQYSRDLDIRNIEALPKGTGAKYLITLKGQGDELIAKQWARVKPMSLKPDEVLVSMTPPVAEKIEPTTAKTENLTLKQAITRAVEERPSRISHGYTAKNAFYVTKDNRIIPADEFSQVSRGDDIISVHSHSGENWEQYTREHGQESFQPPNAADFDHLRWLIKHGCGNKLAVIMGDGRYIQVEIPEPAQPRFTRMGRKTLEKLLYPESKGASDAEHLTKLKAVAKEEGWLLTEGNWKVPAETPTTPTKKTAEAITIQPPKRTSKMKRSPTITIKSEPPKGMAEPVISVGKPPTKTEVDKAISESVDRAISKSKGKVGMLISGGVDSTLLLDFVAKRDKPIAFTIVTDTNHPDLAKAQEVAEKYGLEHHIIMPSKQDIERARQAIGSRGRLFKGDIAVYLALEEAKGKGVDTILATDGIDEQVGGYWWHAHESDKFDSKEDAFKFYWDRLNPEHIEPMLDSANRLGVQVEFPFLDKEVVATLNKLPLNERVKSETPKAWWKDYARNYVPEDIVNRPKIGFVAALDEELIMQRGV